MNRRNRTGSFIALFLALGAHLYRNDFGPLAWTLLGLNFLLYPQLVYWRARRASDTLNAELNNLLLDALLFGGWIAALGYPVWIAFALAMGIGMNLTVFRGPRGLVQALIALAVGCVTTSLITGVLLRPNTDPLTTALCIGTISVYLLMVGNVAYQRNQVLHDAREKLRRDELLLKQHINEIDALQAQLREQANRDPLTGLYNRRYLDATLERELLRCIHESSPASLLLIDIDHFKRVNDRYGHQAGDVMLNHLAAVLESGSRGSDLVCRFGGEEFLVFMPGVAPSTALERAEQYRQAFADQIIDYADVPLRGTLSVGVASLAEHADSARLLIRCADTALYEAKAAGRNRVSEFGRSDEAPCDPVAQA